MPVLDSTHHGFQRPPALELPRADVRSWLNERAVREWTESSRRVVRCLTLYTVDSIAVFSRFAFCSRPGRSSPAIANFQMKWRCWRPYLSAAAVAPGNRRLRRRQGLQRL